MKEIIIEPVERGRIWLRIHYGQQEVRFAYPPVQGTHQECFKAINKDSELRPAEGLELALLARGAYTNKQKEWKDIRQNCFVNNYTRAPCRLLLIPAGHMEDDATLAGVVVENDIKGVGLSTKMQIPDLSHWKQKDGIYHSLEDTSFFIPSIAYEGKSFEHDGIAHAHLTPDGAEVFAKTAVDAGKIPHDWIAQQMKEITEPEQRVSVLDEDSGRLDLDGDGWGDGWGGRAFGVCRGAEGAAGKKI